MKKGDFIKQHPYRPNRKGKGKGSRINSYQQMHDDGRGEVDRQVYEDLHESRMARKAAKHSSGSHSNSNQQLHDDGRGDVDRQVYEELHASRKAAKRSSPSSSTGRGKPSSSNVRKAPKRGADCGEATASATLLSCPGAHRIGGIDEELQGSTTTGATRPNEAAPTSTTDVGGDSNENSVPIAAFAVGGGSDVSDVTPLETESEREERIRRQLVEGAPLVDGSAVVHSSDRKDDLKEPWWQRHRVLLVVSVVIVIALVVTLAVVFSSSSSSDSSKSVEQEGNAPPLMPTEVPTASPSSSPTSLRFFELGSLLLQIDAVADPETLMDGKSPQFEALRWLADEDPQQLDETNSETIAQRFALVTLFYSTNGNEWVDSFGFLNGTNECFWNERDNIFEDGERFGASCEGSGNGTLVDKISLCENNLNGSIPEEIWRLTSLTNLSVCHNDITGTMSASVGTLSNLVWLDLDFNSLKGTVPPSIGDLSSEVFTSFTADKNQLTGTLPTADLQRLSNMRNLSLASNDLTGTLPFVEDGEGGITAATAPNWRWVYFGGNNLNGTIPPSIGRYQNLQIIDIDNNNLSGEIPPELGSIDVLAWLNFGDNNLNGSLPTDLANATNLFRLQFHGNELSGSLPSVLGSLTKLKRVEFDGNKLMGEIPSEMGDLPLLRILHLNDNVLNGTVPTSFLRLNSLASLRLQRNNLTGEIDFLCNNSITDLLADCLEDELEVSCGCCSFCCDDTECVVQF